MAAQEGINDTRPREAIPAMKDESTAGNVEVPADRQSLDNGSSGRGQFQPDVMTRPSLRAVIAQSLVAGGALLLTTCCGIDFGYSAVLVPQLKAENSTLPTDDELSSWIASVQAIASAFGIILSGLMMERWGRRRALLLCSVTFTAGWIILAFATNHATILTARAMSGFSSGLTILLTQVVVEETSEPRISAILTATKFVSHSLGILLVYILGAAMQWNTASGVIAALPLLSIVAFVQLPESPVWLVKRNRIQEAEKALRWLRGGGVGLQAKRELEQLISQYRSRDHESPSRDAGTTRTQRCCQDVSRPHILKPLIIVSVVHLIQILTGTYLLIFYAVDIITEAGIGDGLRLDSFLAAVITAAVRLLFVVFACFLLRWTGRRPLLLIAGSLQAIAALSVGTFLYAKNALNITDYEFPACKAIITASLLTYVASNACSYFAIPGNAMAELLPNKIRGYAGVRILAGASLAVFVTTMIFPWLCNLLGVHGVFSLFGAATAIGTFVMYLLLPESIGMSAGQIENYFRQPNTMWVGRNVVLRRGETKPKIEYHEMQVRS